VLAQIRPRVEALVQSLGAASIPERPQTRRAIVKERLRARGADPAAFSIGLVDPSRQSGTLVFSVPGLSQRDRSPDSVLDLLTAYAWAGGGSHSLFMNTWAAGLAYNNGIQADTRAGRLQYYAERSPLLPDTLRFAIDTLRSARADRHIAEYAVAQVFSSRAAGTFEGRTLAVAADLVDLQGPGVVRDLRQAVLAAARRPDLVQQIEERKARVLGPLFPGLGAPPARTKDGDYFVIGPEKQLAAWQEYLRSTLGSGHEVERLYGRDFWIVEP
jgi:hypothetical protein